jgi:hypothetical protein
MATLVGPIWTGLIHRRGHVGTVSQFLKKCENSLGVNLRPGMSPCALTVGNLKTDCLNLANLQQ